MIGTRLLTLAFATALCTTGPVLHASNTEAPSLSEAVRQFEAALKTGDKYKIRDAARHAWAAGRNELPEDHKDLATLSLNYGIMLWETNELDDASKQLEDALERHEALYGKQSRGVIEPLIKLGNVQSTLRGGVAPAHRRALRIVDGIEPEDLALKARVEFETGKSALGYGRSRRGRSHLRKALALFEEMHGAEHEKTAQAHFWLGKHNLAIGAEKQAIEHFEESLVGFGTRNPDGALRSHAFLVRTFEEQGDRKSATKHCQAIGAMRPFDLDRQQEPLYIKPPEYPQQALKKGRKGYAILEFTIDEEGFTKDGAVLEAKGSPHFGDAALEVLERWRFAPRFEEGRPVATEGMKYRITFDF